ncbi:unnamed protein product [Phyllotreta striolata]|uniref:Uncharacterized protein n=1 Tax=Phyllotreta striolata TaxID=444603 RepID=A0A9N9TII0_PHYSR|nr:unnamed protein product [Phyllotreta striolata]
MVGLPLPVYDQFLCRGNRSGTSGSGLVTLHASTAKRALPLFPIFRDSRAPSRFIQLLVPQLSLGIFREAKNRNTSIGLKIPISSTNYWFRKNCQLRCSCVLHLHII